MVRSESTRPRITAMCSSAKMPATPAPVQEAKNPDFQAQQAARRKAALTGGGTLLTGPSGIDNAARNQARPTLLGS